MPVNSKKLFLKFLKWRYQHISNKQFTNFASAIIGLLAGLGAVVLKNFTHFIQHSLEGGFISKSHLNTAYRRKLIEVTS